MADGNFLVFKKAIYGGFESNCCPSGEEETYYYMIENRLVATNHSFSLSPEMRELVVQNYYNKLEAKDYRGAYEWNLSYSFQAANPYSQWVTEYQTAKSIAFKTSELPDGSIGVDFTKTDLTASGEVAKHWFAKWVLVATPQGWRLNSIQLEQLP